MAAVATGNVVNRRSGTVVEGPYGIVDDERAP
jgi:hypothetical protein